MAAGPWKPTNATIAKIFDGTLKVGDTYKMALFTSASNLGAGSTTYAGVTGEVANGSGYTTGGASMTLSQSTATGPPIVETVDGTDVSWTASGGNIVARFACIYEVGGNVLCYCLLDSTPGDVTIQDGGPPFTVTIDPAGIFTGTYTP